MKIILAFCFTTYCLISNAQNFEVSVAGGLGQYGLWGKDARIGFGEARLSTMASVLYKRNWKNNSGELSNTQYGIGLTYTSYGSNFSTTGGENIAPPRGFYDSYVHVVGLEITPIIATIGKGCSIRTGLFLGGVIQKDFEGREVLTTVEYVNGVSYGGESTTTILENGTVENIVLHWNTRLGYDFRMGDRRLGPFVQFSSGLLGKVKSRERRPASFCLLAGVTFGL